MFTHFRPTRWALIGMAGALTAVVAIAAFVATSEHGTVRTQMGPVGASQQGTTATNGHLAPGRPQPNWDRPIEGGLPVTLGTARAAGNLAFSPALPHLAGGATSILVTNPASTPVEMRSLAATFKLPITPQMADGRLVIIESPSQVTADELESVAESNANQFGSDHFRLVKVAGHTGMLVEDNGVARLHLIVGATAYDITGPDTPESVVLNVSEQLAAGL
jgi:hypothetical protein